MMDLGHLKELILQLCFWCQVFFHHENDRGKMPNKSKHEALHCKSLKCPQSILDTLYMNDIIKLPVFFLNLIQSGAGASFVHFKS